MKQQVFGLLKAAGILKWLNSYKRNNSLLTVLCFHRINNEKDPFFPSLSPEIFDQLLDYISQNFEVIHPDDLNNDSPSTQAKLLLTFDDGYRDFIENAVPILSKYKLPSLHGVVYESVSQSTTIWTQRLNNIFHAVQGTGFWTLNILDKSYSFTSQASELVSTAHSIMQLLMRLPKTERERIMVDIQGKLAVEPKTEKMLDFNDLKACMKANVVFASHSMTHDSLITASDENLEKEILGSKHEFEKQLNTSFDHFIFPNGLYNSKVVEKSINAGYKYLHVLDDQWHKESVNNAMISRLPVYHDTFLENMFKVEGFHNFVKSPYRKFK